MSEVRRLAIVTAAAVALAAGIGLRPGSAQSNGPAEGQDRPGSGAKNTGVDPVSEPSEPGPASKPDDGRQAPAIPADPRPGTRPSATVDPEVVPAQAPGGDGSGFAFPRPEALPEGPHAVGLTVDVQGPKSIFLNKTAVLWIVVKNSGTTDALGVGVREQLPEGLEFVESSPMPASKAPFLFWDLKTMPGGNVQRIKLVVKATKKVNSVDHAPVVTMMTGGRSRLSVLEPRLRVEQRASVSQALKGESIQFDITVVNTGSGPARNVTVTAKLGAGLKYENGDQVVLRLADLDPSKPVLGPNESVTLDPLMVQAVADGEHACTVVAESEDVVSGADEARAQNVVKIVAPKLSLDVKGPAKRYTDTTAPYRVIVENTGSAVARNVRVGAQVDRGGELVEKPEGATWKPNATGGVLFWTLGDLEPRRPVELTFNVRLKGIQRYSVRAATKADSLAQEEKSWATDVSGMADLTIKVAEAKRVVDVGESTVFTVKIVNRGSSDAKKLLVAAKLSEHLDPEGSAGTDQPADANHTTHEVRFPVIENLPPGGALTLSIQAKALKSGFAKCNVEIRHDDLGPDGKQEDSEGVRVSEAAAPAP